MRLPWGRLQGVNQVFMKDRIIEVLGALSFEERCCAVPSRLFADGALIQLLDIESPLNAFPTYGKEIEDKIRANREQLEASGVSFRPLKLKLLATEDELLDILKDWNSFHQSNAVVVLDITTMPKRFFCFLLKRLSQQVTCPDIIVTYTEAGRNGYTLEHLSEDPMTCDHLPGFSAPLPPEGDTLVVSLGYESLSLRSLMEVYNDRKRAIKIIVPFPSFGRSTNRLWRTIREIGVEPQEIRGNIESIASWDAEEVYFKLRQWHGDAEGLTLAPFGPKTHSLGMALFALNYDAGLYYTQPKSYHPDYSTGYSDCWAYVVKWQGVPCFERYSSAH